MSELEIQQMTRAEKWRLMDLLWEDLCRDEKMLDSPAWHEGVLAETEQRLAKGQEQVLDWERVKADLRKRSV